MVQNKFGIPQVAQRQLEIFSTAVLLATESPPMRPRKPEWRAIMDRLSTSSCAAYRAVSTRPPSSALRCLSRHCCSTHPGRVLEMFNNRRVDRVKHLDGAGWVGPTLGGWVTGGSGAPRSPADRLAGSAI